MAFDFKTATPDTSIPSTGFLFGADSQASTDPSIYSLQTIVTATLGSTTQTGETVTASTPVIDQTQTWNNAAITFTGWKLNVTNTASNAASLLADLQVGGASQFRVDRSGSTYVGSSGGNFSDGSGGTLNVRTGGTTAYNFGNAYLGLISRGLSMGASLGAQDMFLTRKAAASLRFGAADAAAPVAQTLSVQSVVAGTTNTAGTNLTITGSQGTGTGAGGSIVFQVAPAGSSGSAQNALATALTINADQSVAVATNMTIGDISGTVGTLTIGAGQLTGLVFRSRGKIYAHNDGVFAMRDNAGTGFGRLTFGGTSSSFPALKRSTTFLQAVLADDSAACGFSAANVQAATAYTVATLPTPATGMIARVTDATAPSIGSTVAGGGAAAAMVWYNGANWTVIGV